MTKGIGENMDIRLQTIIDETKDQYGLENYTLETSVVLKERNGQGDAFYKFNMAFFPNTLTEPLEEDVNPPGTAVVEYNIQRERAETILFVQGQSFSTKTQFNERTAEEVAAWIEAETGYQFGKDFNHSATLENGFQFKADVDGIE